MFTKHSPSEILSFKEEDRLFKLQFSVLMVRLYYTRKDKALSRALHSKSLE